jgi:uncharacterized membrane protein
VSWDELVEDVVRGIEAVGIFIIVTWSLVALVRFVIDGRRPATSATAYQTVRRSLGRGILLGLEILIVADIVRTIVVDPTFESVVVLGLIVVIRIVLSFSLEVEIDGTWPWRRAALDASPEGKPSDP